MYAISTAAMSFVVKSTILLVYGVWNYSIEFMYMIFIELSNLLVTKNNWLSSLSAFNYSNCFSMV